MTKNKKAAFWNLDWFLSTDMMRKDYFKLRSSLENFFIDWSFVKYLVDCIKLKIQIGSRPILIHCHEWLYHRDITSVDNIHFVNDHI